MNLRRDTDIQRTPGIKPVIPLGTEEKPDWKEDQKQPAGTHH